MFDVNLLSSVPTKSDKNVLNIAILILVWDCIP